MGRAYSSPGRKLGGTQGKCPRHKVAFRFACPARLKDAYCPDCGTKLVRTTYLFKGEWREVIYCYAPPKKN